jgi:hypothetical protein
MDAPTGVDAQVFGCVRTARYCDGPRQGPVGSHGSAPAWRSLRGQGEQSQADLLKVVNEADTTSPIGTDDFAAKWAHGQGSRCPLGGEGRALGCLLPNVDHFLAG